MVSGVLRAITLACALLSGACGDDDEAADGGQISRRARESGRGGGGGERDASANELQSGSGGAGDSSAAGSGGRAAGSGPGGVGGRQSKAGAGTGGIGRGCPAGNREALDAFCSMDRAMCGLTLEQRRESYCANPSCSAPSSCAVFEMQSSCGGRVVGTILGVDAVSEYAYYGANGTLVGVEVQRPNPVHPCVIFDVYGETCERIESEIVDCSAVLDGGL